MVNKLKIITMTRLALYDKHEGPADRVANDYFRHDYIYRNNLGTRLAVGLGGLIILLVYWLQALLISDLDIFELELQQHITESVLFLLAILAVYSLIGSIQGTRQYYLVQKRLAQYQALVRQLERLEERAERAHEEEEEDPFRRKEGDTMRYNPSPPFRTPEHTRPREHQPLPSPDRPRRPRPSRSYNGDTRPPRPREHTNPIEHTRTPERPNPIEHTRTSKRPRPVEYTYAPERPSPIEHTRGPDGSKPIDYTYTPERPKPRDYDPDSSPFSDDE